MLIGKKNLFGLIKRRIKKIVLSVFLFSFYKKKRLNFNKVLGKCVRLFIKYQLLTINDGGV